MKLLFLGVSSAFAVGENMFQSNMLVTSEAGKRLLIDCGSDARHSLYAQGYTHSDIHAVYVSHMHSDHVGGLEWLGFCKHFIDGQKPELYVSTDQRDVLWNNVLSGGMSTLDDEQATLSTFFDVKPIVNDSFVWENYTFRLVQTEHTHSNGRILPSYGLYIEGAIHKIFITTDTRFTPNSLSEHYELADLIFHDCETSNHISEQHSRYNELKRLNSKIRKKMWLYDYNSGKLPDAKADGFQGFVVRGQCFDF